MSEPTNQYDESHILVVRPGALGDTILGIPLLNSIRERHPAASLTFLGNSRYRFLVPGGIEFHSIDHPDWLWLFGSETSTSTQVLSRRSFQYPHPNPLPEGEGASGFGGLKDAKQILGRRTRYHKAYLVLTQPDIVAGNLKASGTHSVVQVPSRPSAHIHVVEHLHQGFGLPIPPRKAILTDLGPGESRPLIWLHPGSGGPRKCVPLDSFLALAQRLRDGLGWDMAVTAGEEDEFLMDHLDWTRLINAPRTQLLKDLPFGELCKILGAARLFVGNDSGIGHLAANLGIPSAVLFVSTEPVQWAPWVPEDQLKVIDLRGSDLSSTVLRRVGERLLAWADATRW